MEQRRAILKLTLRRHAVEMAQQLGHLDGIDDALLNDT